MKIPDKINPKILKKNATIVGVLFLAVFLFFCFQIYFPANPFSTSTITYVVKKGMGDEDIANDLQKLGVIRNSYFFQLYEIMSFRHSSLQAGKYNFSPRMSVYQIVKKLSSGDIVKNKFTILEGWDLEDIGAYLQEKNMCTKDEFLKLSKTDHSEEFSFLKDKPTDIGLEGFIFPDTYEIADGDSCQDFIGIALSNFDKKLTPEIRAEIIKQKKSIFDIITMASMIEKEVKKYEDKKIVSGILWSRIRIGMPLQLDCTVNYVTGKSDASARIKDTKIDSPYNTYKYKGLPKGPISSPGIDSIKATIYPTKTDYLYWLSDGITHYSKTFQEHIANKQKYLD